MYEKFLGSNYVSISTLKNEVIGSIKLRNLELGVSIIAQDVICKS